MTQPPAVPGPGPVPDDAVPTCYRHPNRETYVRCQRCDRPICPECQIPAAVGVQCPDDVREGNRNVRQARTTLGGVVQDGGAMATMAILALTVIVSALAEFDVGNLTDRLEMLSGAQAAPQFGGVVNGEYYRLLTVALVHGGWFHLLVNMYSLWVLGSQLEPLLGRARFVGLYIVGALGGSAASYALNPAVVDGRFLFHAVGASGAIFALFGAMVPVMRRLKLSLAPIAVMLALNAYIGFQVPNIDWRAHLGGLLIGMLVGTGLAYAPKDRRTEVQAAAFVLAIVVIAAVVVVRTSQLTG